MITKKEILTILIVAFFLSISIGFFREISLLPGIALAVFLIILVNTIAKKVTSFYLESEIEIRPWTIEKYGFRPHQRFRKPLQSGIIFPIVTTLLTLGNFVWMASVIFDVKPKIYRAVRRHGLYSHAEMTEDHIGLIAAVGVFANLLFAVVGYLIGFPEFSRINIYFALFNMLPLSELDGNKILFGNKILWSFLGALVIVGLGYTFFLV